MDDRSVLRPTENSFRPVIYPNSVRCINCGNITVQRITMSGANGVACAVCSHVYCRAQMAEMEKVERLEQFTK